LAALGRHAAAGQHRHALAFDVDILLIDEPFGALDEIVRDHLNEQPLALRARTGKICLFVARSIPEAVCLSTRVVVMNPRPGRIADEIDRFFKREVSLDCIDKRDSREGLSVFQDRICRGDDFGTQPDVGRRVGVF